MSGKAAWMGLWSKESSAAGDTTCWELAMCLPAPAPWSEAMPWPRLVLWTIAIAKAGVVSHLWGLGWHYEPSLWPGLVLSAISVAWVAAMSHLPPCDSGAWPIHHMSPVWLSSVELSNDGRSKTGELLCVERLQKWELCQYIFLMKMLRQNRGQVFWCSQLDSCLSYACNLILAVSMHLPYPPLPKTLVPKVRNGRFWKVDLELLVAVIPVWCWVATVWKGGWMTGSCNWELLQRR